MVGDKDSVLQFAIQGIGANNPYPFGRRRARCFVCHDGNVNSGIQALCDSHLMQVLQMFSAEGCEVERYATWYVVVGACQDHLHNLRMLCDLVGSSNQITAEVIRQAKAAVTTA